MYWDTIRKILLEMIEDCDPNLDTALKVEGLQKFIEELETIITRQNVQTKLLDFCVVVDRELYIRRIAVRSTFKDREFSLARTFPI